MNMQRNIEDKLVSSLAPAHLEVANESHMHSVPPGSESHFRVVIVADAFEGVPLVGRHQRINALLAAELEGPVHALSMQTLTPAEWARRSGQTMASPPCHGKAKKET